MSLDEGVSHFIGRLYEAVYDGDLWRSAVEELMGRTRSRLVFISHADLRHREYSKLDFFGPQTSACERGQTEYLETMYQYDPSLAWASKHPAAGMCDTSRIMPHDEFRNHDYVKWQESHFGTVHWRVFYTQPVDDLCFGLSLHPPASEGPASREHGRLHKLLFEHMERALRLAARPPDLADSREAVIVLDTVGKVVSMSDRAEQLVGASDGLALARRRLSAATPEATGRLNLVIASAVKSGTVGGAGGGVRLVRPSGKADWIVLVSPCPRHLEHLPVPTPAAILRILDADPNLAIQPGQASLFDLTQREAEVAGGLLKGHSLESLAQALGISRNTAKVHLQSLFRKTGTNRQSELVHLLSDIARH